MWSFRDCNGEAAVHTLTARLDPQPLCTLTGKISLLLRSLIFFHQWNIEINMFKLTQNCALYFYMEMWTNHTTKLIYTNIKAVLMILLTVKHKVCISTAVKTGQLKSWFVKQKSFCCRSVVQLHTHWHHNSQQWTMAISVLTVWIWKEILIAKCELF